MYSHYTTYSMGSCNSRLVSDRTKTASLTTLSNHLATKIGRLLGLSRLAMAFDIVAIIKVFGPMGLKAETSQGVEVEQLRTVFRLSMRGFLGAKS